MSKELIERAKMHSCNAWDRRVILKLCDRIEALEAKLAANEQALMREQYNYDCLKAMAEEVARKHDALKAELAALKRPDFLEMREMLRAMQAGELTVSRGIEILEIWSAGGWNDNMLPPVRTDLIEEDSMPVEIIDRLKAELATHVAALDEQMASTGLGVFNQGDDPKATIKLLMDWAQGSLAFFAKEEIKDLQEELATLKEANKSLYDGTMRQAMELAALKAQEPVAWEIIAPDGYKTLLRGPVELPRYVSRPLIYASSVPGTPEGYVLVPKEPTKEMIDNVLEERMDALATGKDHTFIDIYRAMIAAAPGEKK